MTSVLRRERTHKGEGAVKTEADWSEVSMAREPPDGRQRRRPGAESPPDPPEENNPDCLQVRCILS